MLSREGPVICDRAEHPCFVRCAEPCSVERPVLCSGWRPAPSLEGKYGSRVVCDGFSVAPQLQCFDPIAREPFPGDRSSSSTDLGTLFSEPSCDASSEASQDNRFDCIVACREFRERLEAIEIRQEHELASMQQQIVYLQSALASRAEHATQRQQELGKAASPSTSGGTEEDEKTTDPSSGAAEQLSIEPSWRACLKCFLKALDREVKRPLWDVSVAMRELQERLEAMDRQWNADVSELRKEVSNSASSKMEQAATLGSAAAIAADGADRDSNVGIDKCCSESHQGGTMGRMLPHEECVPAVQCIVKARLGSDLRRAQVILRNDRAEGDLAAIQDAVRESFKEQLSSSQRFTLEFGGDEVVELTATSISQYLAPGNGSSVSSRILPRLEMRLLS